ncbi:helix-turn-helix domain-containing protein [Streptomyces sp. NPDC001933]|uniref:MmyB family transcriptional regulator n=1 Tax=Streptomyces sp. NPDC001933 TaxID=3364626 RepID=UPI0036C15AFF
MMNKVLERRPQAQLPPEPHDPPPRLKTRSGKRQRRDVATKPDNRDKGAEVERARQLRDFIKGRREHLGLSQREVASSLGITCRSYGNWENGRVSVWTDQKLYSLARSLRMTDFQTTRLFWLAVDRDPQPDPRRLQRPLHSRGPDATAFLADYSVMMNALSLPTFLMDHRWEVRLANTAYRELFRAVRHHPTAMPDKSFLRFGLFHPGAPQILTDHRNWRLSLLAQLAASLDRHSQDPALQAIYRDVHSHPTLRTIYLRDMPDWVLGAGAGLVGPEGSVRELRHPDPGVGLQACRIVEETPRSLQTLGLTRITFVLTEHDDVLVAEQGRPSDCHRPSSTCPARN